LKNRPAIFIVGVPRSGTTLLRFILNRHKDIYCGPESPWLTGTSEHCVSIRELYYQLKTSRRGLYYTFPDFEEQRLNDIFRQFVHSIFYSRAQQLQKDRWAEKTPENIVQLPFLIELFPEAKFVHIIRDARDVAVSTINKPWKTLSQTKMKNTFKNALTRWKLWINNFEEYEKSLKFDHYEIRFEDLILDYKDTITSLFAFLEEEPYDEVLHFANGHFDQPAVLAEGEKSLKTTHLERKSVFRWKTSMNLYQRIIARCVCDKKLIELGYEPTPIIRTQRDALHMFT
jgi:protein-tyrosine sulfotransferase